MAFLYGIIATLVYWWMLIRKKPMNIFLLSIMTVGIAFATQEPVTTKDTIIPLVVCAVIYGIVSAEKLLRLEDK